MRIHRSYWCLPSSAHHGVVAISSFDGVHRGHRALIAAAREKAATLGAPLGVIAFEPHPREVLTPERAPPRLTPFRLKARLLAEAGVEHLFALAFNAHLMAKTPEQFVHDVLAGGLGVRHVVVGYDFRFGHQRAGDVARLAALGEEYDFGLTCVEPVAWRGEVCSSSRVRDAVAAGEVALANDLLGQPFAVEGRVVTGDRRGRELGYPTANLCPPARRALWPQAGIYAVRAGWTARVGGLAGRGREPRLAADLRRPGSAPRGPSVRPRDRPLRPTAVLQLHRAPARRGDVREQRRAQGADGPRQRRRARRAGRRSTDALSDGQPGASLR